MIRASKRQRDKLTADGQLEQHLHLAKQFFWQRQLLHCSLTAFAASVLAYLFAAPLLWHAALVAVGFVAGFLWMNRDGLTRALRYIEDGIGLSYSTALEHAASPPDDVRDASQTDASQTQADVSQTDASQAQTDVSQTDASLTDQAQGIRASLYQSVLQRAHYRIRRLDAPKLQPWWLPLLALALSLLILPDINLPGINRRNADMRDPVAAARPLASSSEEGANQPAPRQDANPQPAGDRSPADSSSAATEDGDDATSARDDAPPASESDTLSRFVDNLGEGGSSPTNSESNNANPENEGREPQTGGQATPRAGDQEFRQVPPDDRSRDAQSGETPPASGDGQQRSQNSQDGEQQGESGQGETGEGQQRVNSGESPDDSPQGESQAESGDPQAGDQVGDNENPQAGTQSQPQSSPNAPPDEAGEGQTSSAQSGDEQGAGENPEEALGEPSNGAGSQGGFGQGEGEELSNMSDPEQLEGTLEQGTINTGGQVRLPGDDDVTLPGGSAPAEYQQGVERALSEGRIPVEYQEILRSYFR